MAKGYLSILFIGIQFLFYFPLFAQTPEDSIRIQGSIPIERADAAKWVKRFQKDIDLYEEANKTSSDTLYDVLFLGSSSIHLWKTLVEDMAPLKILKRSYGGSTIRDIIHNYPVVAKNHNVRKIALYVENDLSSHKEGIGPGECYDLFRLFLQELQKDYPEVPIYIISFKPSFARQNQLSDQLIVNRLLKDYAGATPNLHYIDITAVMYDDKGKLREDIFLKDRLHLNSKGYELWTQAIRPCLID